MFSFLKIENLFDFNDRVGVDIDDNSIKLVQIKNEKENNVLHKAGFFSLPKDCFSNGRILDEQKLKDFLFKAFQKFNLSSKKIVYTIPEKNVFRHSVLSSYSDDEKIQELVKNEIVFEHNKSFDDFCYTWKIADYLEEENKYLVDISFVKKSIVQEMDKIFSDLNLDVLGCEFEVNAYLNFLNREFFDKSLLVIDISDKNSNFTIYEKGSVKITTTSSFSSDLMTDILSKTLNISYEQAEKMKKRENIGSVFNSDYFFSAIQPVVDGLILEIKNLENFYYENFSSQPIEEILVVGGGAKMKGLTKYLSYCLNKKEVNLTRSNDVLISKDLNLKSEDLMQYLVAIGTVLDQKDL